MKKIFVLSILLCLQSLFSQKTQKKKYEYAFSPGVIKQGDYYFGEANVLIGEVVDNKILLGMTGVRVGAETNFRDGKDFMIAPKIGVEASATFVSMRFSAVNYFQNGYSEFWLVPEIGISYGGSANLTYGYGFQINNSGIDGLNKHRLTLSFNINKELMSKI